MTRKLSIRRVVLTQEQDMTTKKSGTRKKATRKATARKGAKAGSLRKAATRSRAGTDRNRAPNPEFFAPLKPSEALEAVLGTSKPMSRSEVTRRVWAYIEQNGLQDAKNPRMIRADDKMLKVFDQKGRVSMFEMQKLLDTHLGKVDSGR